VLIRQLATTSSRGGNYLLNVGPTAEGIIPQASVERLGAVGQWMKVNSESIYGTSSNPFPYELPWGVITTKPGKMYLHVFEWPKGNFVLYGLKSQVRQAFLLADAGHKALPVQQNHDANHDSLTVKAGPAAPDKNDSVILLETAGTPAVEKALQQQPDGSITLPAYLANMHQAAAGPKAKLDSRGVMEGWLNKDEWADWMFQVSSPGEFEVEIVTSEQKYGKDWEGGHRIKIDLAGKEIRGVMSNDGHQENPSNPYWPYVISKPGRASIQKSGMYRLSLKPESIESQKKLGLTLVSVKLMPRSSKP
jgi:alpha-L-fucosidase